MESVVEKKNEEVASVIASRYLNGSVVDVETDECVRQGRRSACLYKLGFVALEASQPLTPVPPRISYGTKRKPTPYLAS